MLLPGQCPGQIPAVGGQMVWKHPFVDMHGSCPLRTVTAYRVGDRRGLESLQSDKWCFYLSWNPGIGLDDTSPILDGMSTGCF